MSDLRIVDAEEVISKARIGIAGPAGSGKTYSALSMSRAFGSNVVVIDTENRTSAKYARKFGEFKFKVIPIDGRFPPSVYIDAIRLAERRMFDVIIIDSLSHAWFGTGGELEMVDNAAGRYGGNRWAGWRDVTPEHNRLLDTLVRCPAHLICTLRSKVDYSMERDETTGRSNIQKLGTSPIQREGIDYELDIYGDIDLKHNWRITKTRYSELDGMIINKPGIEVGELIVACLNRGTDPVAHAEKMFFEKHSIFNRSWDEVKRQLDIDLDKPDTVDGWSSIEIIMGGL